MNFYRFLGEKVISTLTVSSEGRPVEKERNYPSFIDSKKGIFSRNLGAVFSATKANCTRDKVQLYSLLYLTLL
jgi:hypothetical protein